MGRGHCGLFRGTKGSKTVYGFITKVNKDKQNKHIPTSKNYVQGKSIISISATKCQQLINTHAGTGTKLSNNKERIDFGEIIGTYISHKTGKHYPTTMGIVHYSKTGTHIVPATPKGFKEE